MSQSKDMNITGSVSALIGVALLVALIYTLTAGRFESDEVTVPEAIMTERLAPIGKVNTDVAAVAAPAAPAGAAAASGDPGEALYNRVCQACHAAGVAGAPLLGNKEAWQPRVDQGEAALLQSVVNGKGAMPPKAGCTDCSEDELKAAIDFMLSKLE